MLTSLRIENFAIVSELELDFSNGMTAFTGETGAGKSIMIDALMLALGDRADASVVRVGADKCEIHALFTCDPHSTPMQWLAQHDILSDEGEILLRRIIFAEGRSKSTINGMPFPLQKIKELSETLVDIHGQHQHQTLLKHATHRQQLDQFANHHALLSEVSFLYRQCLALKEKLNGLQNQESTDERAELIQYQIEELSQLSLQEGEVKALHEEHQLLHHAREYLVNTQLITQLLNADEGQNIRRGLHEVSQQLASLPQDNRHILAATDLINSTLIQCDEALDEMTHFVGQVQLDPERLEAVEARMSALHFAARKYHVDVNQLPAHTLFLQNEHTRLQNVEKEKQQLGSKYDEAVKAYETAAQKLNTSRKLFAIKLADAITITIQKLGMPKGFMIVEISPLDKMQVHGFDKVEYKVCTNPGMLPDLLNKVASGGELSRISLAIQLITAEKGTTPTLLFDEVDVGIGGATAALVGNLLRQLGERLQLFCVTHQPQVASCANHHFLVEKHSENEQTFSRVIELNEMEKVNEIARMLGGLTITEHTRSHAKELLAQ